MTFTDEDFYIGYETPIPARSRLLLIGVISTCVVAAVAVAIVVVVTQQPFAAATFAFGNRTVWTGTVRTDPYPTLETGDGRVLIAGPGKRGADDALHEVSGRQVRLEGSLIERGSHRMVELVPGTITLIAERDSGRATLMDLGETTLRGEIVDGKCFLGVMNPGEGTVHRDCARACLRGGLPAMFAVTLTDGTLQLMELADLHGESVSTRVSHLAGRRVSIRGRLFGRQPGGQLVLRAAVSAIHLD